MGSSPPLRDTDSTNMPSSELPSHHQHSDHTPKTLTISPTNATVPMRMILCMMSSKDTESKRKTLWAQELESGSSQNTLDHNGLVMSSTSSTLWMKIKLLPMLPLTSITSGRNMTTMVLEKFTNQKVRPS